MNFNNFENPVLFDLHRKKRRCVFYMDRVACSCSLAMILEVDCSLVSLSKSVPKPRFFPQYRIEPKPRFYASLLTVLEMEQL